MSAASVHPLGKLLQLLGSGVMEAESVVEGVRVAVVVGEGKEVGVKAAVALEEPEAEEAALVDALGSGEAVALRVAAVGLPLPRGDAVPRPAEAVAQATEAEGEALVLAARAGERLPAADALPLADAVLRELGVTGRDLEGVARALWVRSADGLSLGDAVERGGVGEAVEGREGVTEGSTLPVPCCCCCCCCCGVAVGGALALPLGLLLPPACSAPGVGVGSADCAALELAPVLALAAVAGLGVVPLPGEGEGVSDAPPARDAVGSADVLPE